VISVHSMTIHFSVMFEIVSIVINEQHESSCNAMLVRFSFGFEMRRSYGVIPVAHSYFRLELDMNY